MNGIHRSHDGESYVFMYKILLVGDAGVGKTCLLLRFKDGNFAAGSYIATVGIDYKSKVIEVDNIRVKLQMWDTAGQERFRSITKAYYRDSHAVMLLYDITSQASFQNIRSWLNQIKTFAPEQTILMLIGNKMDCDVSDRQVSFENGQQLAAEYSILFMETSAKVGTNVDSAFQALTRDMVREIGNPKSFKACQIPQKEDEKKEAAGHSCCFR